VAGGSAEIGVVTISGQLPETSWPATGIELTNIVAVSGDQAEAITGNNIFTVTNWGVPGDPYTVTVTPAVAEATVGTDVLVTVFVTDQFGNPARDETTVGFTSLPVGSSVDPGSTTTSAGVATTTLSSLISATVTLNASAGLATGSAEVIFHPGPLYQFAIGVTSPQTAGSAFTTVITALDEYGNVVDFDDTVALVDTTGTLVLAGPPALVDGQGAISATVYTATPADVITATWGITPIIGVSGPFAVQPGAPDTLTVTAYPTTMRVCQSAVVTTTLSDPWGNLVPNQLVDLTVLAFPLPGGSATLTPTSGNTGPTAVFNATLLATGAGNVRIYGEKSGGTPNNGADMPTLTINDPPLPTDVSLGVAPNPLYADGATAVVSATVIDCQDVSPGQVVTFTLSDPALAWFPGFSDTYVATTDASGVATATLTSNSIPMTGTVTITGTVEGLSDAVSLSVELPPTPSLTINKTANPSGGNVRFGQTIDYTLVARNTGGAEATGIVISDTLPAGLGLVSATASSGTVSSFSPLNVVAGMLPAGEAITVSVEVTVATEISGMTLTNRASVDSNETDIVFSSLVSHQVISNTRGTVFVPIVLKNWDGTTPPSPTNANLSVIDIGFLDGTDPAQGEAYDVYVVVSNIGTEPVTGDFWVDLYLNPISTPTPNRPWQSLSQSGVQGVNNCPEDPMCYGRAWRVTRNLAPSEVFTLTTQMPVDERYDRWPAGGAPYASRHSPIMALVDSWGTLAYGAIYEENETDNLSGGISGAGLLQSGTVQDMPIILPLPVSGQRPSLPQPRE
jgi:uncharacterized repeat protein (TIGR01451 family)